MKKCILSRVNLQIIAIRRAYKCLVVERERSIRLQLIRERKDLELIDISISKFLNA